MIARFIYRNPIVLWLALAAIVWSGFQAIDALPRLEDPILSKRVGVISTIFPGENPERIESLVTIQLERQLAGIEEVNQVRSNSRSNISNIVIELKDEVKDVAPVWAEIQQRIGRDAMGEALPAACGTPKLNIFPLKAYAAIVALKPKTRDSATNWHQLRKATRDLQTAIEAIVGTEDVQIYGDGGEEFAVTITPETLSAMGMSTASMSAQVSRAAQQSNGFAPNPVINLSNLMIPAGARGPTALSELATVQQRVIQPGTDQAIIGGENAIVLGVMVDDQMRVDLWSDDLDQCLATFASQNSTSVTVESLFSQRAHIDQRLHKLMRNLAMGTIAVVCVVLLMMGWRSMVVVATALPLSTLMVLSGMRALGIPIHQMSVTGLIVALGLLIDNAIVIVEEVRGGVYDGASPADAIEASVRHLALPLFGSTLTTALAFFPIATLPGPAGEFVGTIAVSVILAISASLILALTVIPAMLGILDVRSERKGLFDYGIRMPHVERLYRASLSRILRSPIDGVVLGLLLPLLGFLVARSLPVQFFPPSDREQIQIEFELPARNSLEDVADSVAKIRALVMTDSRLGSQNWFLGRSAPTFFYNVVPRRRGTPFYAQAFVEVESGGSSTALVRDLQQLLDDRIENGRAIVRQLEQGPPFDAPVELRVLGPDLETLVSIGQHVRKVLAETTDVIHTRSDLEDSVPKFALDINREAAAKAGLSAIEIEQFFYTTTHGAIAGTVSLDGENLPVRIALSGPAKPDLATVRALPIPSRRGRPRPSPESGAVPSVPPPPPVLESVASVRLEADNGAIIRLGGRRVNEVKAYITAGVLPSVVLGEFKRRLADSGLAIPDDYELQVGGESEQRSSAVSKLMANVILLVLAMSLTLIAVFRSIRAAAVIAIVGGLSIGLGPLALAIFGYPFGFMAIVGTMGLVGVAINDSIVVLAAIRAMSAEGQSDPERVADTVFRCTRHILATTITTIAGFIPLVIGPGDFWPPLAIAIAGGVGGATLLALYFVPSLYLLLRRRPSVNRTVVSRSMP